MQSKDRLYQVWVGDELWRGFEDEWQAEQYRDELVLSDAYRASEAGEPLTFEVRSYDGDLLSSVTVQPKATSDEPTSFVREVFQRTNRPRVHVESDLSIRNQLKPERKFLREGLWTKKHGGNND